MFCLQETEEGILFWALIQPRSSKNRIAGVHGDALKINLTAPPVDGAANRMCISFLAEHLGVPKSSVDIRSGHTGRKKRILIRLAPGASAEDRTRIKKAIAALQSV